MSGANPVRVYYTQGGVAKTVEKNVYLVGNDTADSLETRAIFGGSTCASGSIRWFGKLARSI